MTQSLFVFSFVIDPQSSFWNIVFHLAVATV